MLCQAFLEESIILNFLALSYHYMSKKYSNFNYFSYIIIWKFQQSYILGEKKSYSWFLQNLILNTLNKMFKINKFHFDIKPQKWITSGKETYFFSMI